jgi:hypothetical protein
MIETKELRIGNWVELENHVCALNKTTFKAILFGNYKSLNPVPITEEWLLKLGFKFNNFNEDYYFENFSFRLHLWKNENEFVYYWKGGNIFIQYVHQLQNLFYCLTGQEI